MAGETHPSARSRALDGLVVAVFVAAAVTQWTVVEDAFISFRYARNLVDGYGLRFNPGESPPVEGFSNLLIVLIAAACEAVAVPPEVVVPVLSLLCGVGALLLTARVLRGPLGVEEGASRWALLALAVLPPFTSWASSGLEPMPQALAFLAAAAGLAFAERPRDQWLAGVAGLALVLLRTEGIAWSPVLLVLAAALRRLEGRPVLPAAGRYLAVVVPGAAAWLAWKVAYFGSLLSNVALVKVAFGLVTLERGLAYVATFLLVELWPALVLVGALGVAGTRPRVAWAAALATGVLAWSVLVGGDYMAWFRFLVPALPFFTMLLGVVLQTLARGVPGTRRVAVAGAVVAVVGLMPRNQLLLVPQTVLRPLDYSSPNSAEGVASFRAGMFRVPGALRWLEWEARALGAFAKPGSKVVTSAIGLNGYRNPRLVLLDLCGLVSREVARRPVEPSRDKRPGHEKCVGPAFFEGKDPDVLVFGSAVGEHALDEVRDQVAAWREKHPAGRYAPDVVALPADVPGGIVYGFGLRRVPQGRDAQALWASFDERLAEVAERARAEVAVAER